MTLSHRVLGQSASWPILYKVHTRVCVCVKYFEAARLCAVPPAPGRERCVRACSPPERKALQAVRRTAPSFQSPLPRTWTKAVELKLFIHEKLATCISTGADIVHKRKRSKNIKYVTVNQTFWEFSYLVWDVALVTASISSSFSLFSLWIWSS